MACLGVTDDLSCKCVNAVVPWALLNRIPIPPKFNIIVNIPGGNQNLTRRRR